MTIVVKTVFACNITADPFVVTKPDISFFVFCYSADIRIDQAVFPLISLIIQFIGRQETNQSLSCSYPHSFLFILYDLVDSIGTETIPLSERFDFL